MLGLCLGELAAHAVERALHLAHRGGAAPARQPCVGAVGGQVALRGVARVHHRGQLLGVLLQGPECLGHIGQQRLVERGQRAGERRREPAFVGALGELRRADFDQEVDERAVARLAQAKQPLIERAAVLARTAVDAPARADRLLEPVGRQSGAGGVDQPEVLADALVGHEVPVRGDAAAADRLQAAADRAPGLAGLGHASELEPGVAEPFRVRVLAAEQQVPLHPLARIGVRLDPVGGEVAV